MNRLSEILLRACYLATCVLVALHLFPSPALADVGPVWTAQGAGVAPGEEGTEVQMVSETVMVTVEPLEPPSDETWIRMDHLVTTHVEATFLMRNQGTEAEELEVWFPLTTGAEYGETVPYPGQAENFEAWVDGEAVDVEEAPGRDLLGLRDEVPWATWSVTFPAGEDVELRVTYDTHPVEWGGWAVGYYILETGAGWHGPIGEGSVTFRLPYEVTPLSVQLAEIREAYTGPERPFEITVDGTDVTWHFTDLEPQPSEELRTFEPSTDTDNVILPMMEPSAWAEIQAARAAVEEEPESVEAQLRLAEALEAGTQRVKYFLANETNLALIERTEAAYGRALELAPEDVDVLAAYLEWLAVPRHQEGGMAIGEGYETVLGRARELAPGDQRIARIEQRVEEWRQMMAGSGSEEPAAVLPATGGPCLGFLAFPALLSALWVWRR
ncbi:MAG: tetratricopeptide repeat protein [Chloroflexota bacterium]